MGERDAEDFPLFTLGIVALPGEVVPLHIFEDRYKAMIDHCVQLEEPFGVLYMQSGGVSELGCSCEITEVVEELEDGKLNILTRGREPFQLLGPITEDEFPYGPVRFLGDESELADEVQANETREAYADLVERVTEARPESEQLDQMSAYAMAATIEFGADAKYELLKLRSENARLELLERLLQSAMNRLDYAATVEARARSNGKVSLGE